MSFSFEPMHESVLKDYFLGLIDESRLSEDLAGSVIKTSFDVITFYVNPLDSQFRVEVDHLVKLCDAVLSEKVNAQHLELIGYCLEASEQFFWDDEAGGGDLVTETVVRWANPEINYPLTVENVRKFRERLLTGEDTFTRVDAYQ